MSGKPIPSQEIRDHVAKIEFSDCFDALPRQRTILRFLMTEALAGHGDRLTEAVIAKELFSNVRGVVAKVEVHRLRTKLAAYYGTEGQSDPLRIIIPKRKKNYEPQFVRWPAVGETQPISSAGSSLRSWVGILTGERVRGSIGHRYFPESYLERPELDRAVDRWLQGRNTPALLLAGPTGTGKTSLLCRMASVDGVLPPNHLPYFIPGHAITAGPCPLLRRINTDCEVEQPTFRSFITDWRRQNPETVLVILVDGLNESTDFLAGLQDAIELAEAIRFGNVKAGP